MVSIWFDNYTTVDTIPLILEAKGKFKFKKKLAHFAIFIGYGLRVCLLRFSILEIESIYLVMETEWIGIKLNIVYN